ncbi:MAG: DUF3305 domain-containing protein [Candidatus Thiosymbion ectosymbiont of Robbea hypermnestra]|nr:DUF3305 domain-containing protein [Candidatus Thiosymbion ectosymbiont of Robbea hypermnestra]
MDTDSHATPASPRAFPVSAVVDFRTDRDRRWGTGHWEVVAVVAGGHVAGGDQGVRGASIRADADDRRTLWTGLAVTLHRDDAESYYHNLMAEHPSLFVVARDEDDGPLEPYLVTASYGEASSYMETDESVFSLPMPPEVYRWVEGFVLEHYVPEERRKRRREDWTQGCAQ